MIISDKFLQSSLLIFLSLAVPIHFYTNRTTLNPRYGKVFYKLGRECQNKCRLNKQLSYFQKAVFYDPNLNDAYYQLAIIYGKKSQHKEEIESYRKVVQLDYSNAQAYFNVGLHYFQNGELDYALRYFLQSDRYKPESHDTTYYMAIIYDKKAMYNKAALLYLKLVSWDSPHSVELCERVWRISKLPDQYEIILVMARRLLYDGYHELWEQIDRYLRTDQVPEFMRNPGHD